MKTHTTDWITVGVIILVLTLTFGILTYTSFQKSTDNNTIKIGVISTLTGFGANWGEDIVRGIDLAVEEINNQGGINNRPIKVIYEDMGEVDLKAAASAGHKFASVDKVDVIVTQWAEDNEVVWPIAAENNIVVVNIGSGSRDVPRSHPLVFMIRPTDELVVNKLVDYALSQGIKNPVMVVDQQAYFESLGSLTNEVWKDKTGNEIKKFSSSIYEKDYRTHFTKIKQGDYDAVFVYILEVRAGVALKSAGELDIGIPRLGFTGADNPVVLNVAQDSAEGLVYPAFVPAEDFFIEKFKNKYGREPVIASDMAYDTIKVIAYAMNNFGTDTESIKKGLHSLKDFPGASGKITINELGERTGKELVLKVIRNGKGELLENESTRIY